MTHKTFSWAEVEHNELLPGEDGRWRRKLTFESGKTMVIFADHQWSPQEIERAKRLLRKLRPQEPASYAFTTSGANPGLQIIPTDENRQTGTIVLTSPERKLAVMWDGLQTPGTRDWKIPFYLMVNDWSYKGVRANLDDPEILDALLEVLRAHGVEARSVGLEDQVYDEPVDD